ncbi:helix-turn-helix domain-containing protein [Imtechella halotolerans]|uniref:XRE family transcriptional regulator n=1 Tax=Imtechella halotolerans K1 TaxID=946077 RepID=I0W5L0_9FLAO|nr:helix-turn-helix transcriptional regulator [Imtechella halotolerans]EID71676.1 XRE family transcriptional regulator [Imtechella halotolerans K1]WMQ64010.1 helix-turn-helix transcriptional regulator [Imtechella halotolerans]
MSKQTNAKSAIEVEIVKLIKERRNKMKRSQTDIAEILSVTRGYIGQIEMDSSPSMYSFDHLNELAKYLDCSLKDFMPKKPL